jgi:hypothetical protein
MQYFSNKNIVLYYNMSVVGKYVGDFKITPFLRVYTAPRQTPDFDNEYPGDFFMPIQLPYETMTAKKIRRPNINYAPAPTNIPLKCYQENSHVAGASLFNAPVNGPMAKLSTPLDIATDGSRNSMSADTILAAFYPQHKGTAEFGAAHTMSTMDNLIRGVRPSVIPLVRNPVSEPTGNMYKPAQMGGKQYHAPFLQSQVGMEELRHH